MTPIHIVALAACIAIGLLVLVACCADLYRHRDAIVSALLMEDERERRVREVRRILIDAERMYRAEMRRLDRRP